MDYRRRRLIDYRRSRRRIGHGPRSSARKQSHSDSRCGRDYKDFAHSKRSPWARWFEPKTKTKPEGLPEGHKPRAPTGLGTTVLARVRKVSVTDVSGLSQIVGFVPQADETQPEPWAVPRGSSRATSKLTTHITLSRERLVDRCRFPDKSFYSKRLVPADNGDLPSRSRRNPYHQH